MRTGCVPPNKEELWKLYVEQKWTTRQCASYFGMSQPWLRKFLKEYNIPQRTRLDYPGSNLGKKFSAEHKKAISQGLKGNTNWLDKKTGKHRNDQRFETKCGNCEKIIKRKRCMKKYKMYFCNLQCFGKYKETLVGEKNPKYSKVIVGCAYCGKQLKRDPKEIKRSKMFFCNFKCNGAWKAENLTGEVVYNWVGGYAPYYGTNWQVQKRLARKRDNHTCQRCGKTKEQVGKNLDVHHLTAFRFYKVERYEEANRLENLITLCGSCHSTVENNKDDEEIKNLVAAWKNRNLDQNI